MLTSDSGKKRKVSGATIIVIVAIGGAVAFGGAIGYLEWSQDSFPTQMQPFSTYANVTSSNFNGTEFAFQIQWLKSGYLPLYSQITSPDTDVANSPVCNIGLSSVQTGEEIFMPFAIEQASTYLDNVNLWIAVKNLTSNTEFTITYNVLNVTAPNNPSDILPITEACYEPIGIE